MTEFEVEDTLVKIILESKLFVDTESSSPFLKGEVYKNGTRNEIKDEDVVVEVLSIDDEQFQNAIVSVRTYVNDSNMGSPKLVPNIGRLTEIAKKYEEVFRTVNSSYALTTSKFRMKLDSVKRERKEDLNQHCVNCLFNLVIRNF